MTLMVEKLGGLWMSSVTLDVTIPEGYAATGEYRIARAGDLYLFKDGEVKEAVNDTMANVPRIILKKVKVRAAYLRSFYFISRDITVEKSVDRYRGASQKLFESDNYFLTKEDAEEALLCVKEVLRQKSR